MAEWTWQAWLYGRLCLWKMYVVSIISIYKVHGIDLNHWCVLMYIVWRINKCTDLVMRKSVWITFNIEWLLVNWQQPEDVSLRIWRCHNFWIYHQNFTIYFRLQEYEVLQHVVLPTTALHHDVRKISWWFFVIIWEIVRESYAYSKTLTGCQNINVDIAVDSQGPFLLGRLTNIQIWISNYVQFVFDYSFMP